MSNNWKNYLVAVVFTLVITAITGLLLIAGQWHIAGLLMMCGVGISYSQVQTDA